MNWIDKSDIDNFLKNKNFDIRLSGNGRWIDQKCTPDVVSIVADCIINYFNSNTHIANFTSMDIWHLEYTERNILDIFKKPGTENHAAKNEYDKFFQQPMELLSYSGVLQKTKIGSRNYYSIGSRDILEFIALSERNSLKFLQIYVEKVLSDTGLMKTFDFFFENPSQNNYMIVKDAFTHMTKTYTKINGDIESWRIFIKVINPLAFKNNSYGTERGRMSKDPITYDMLMYNRDNFRDINSKKPKGLTRNEFMKQKGIKPSSAYYAYCSQKAKKYLRLYNDTFRNCLTEVDAGVVKEHAIQMHHIFPESQFPDISAFYENIIALTPNQHFIYAHPNGNTSRIDRKYQYKCLLCKLKNVCENTASHTEEHIYNKRSFLKILDVGLNTDEFEKMNSFSYDSIVEKLNLYYQEVLK